MSTEPLAIIDRQTIHSFNATLELFTANCNLRCVYCAIQTDKTDFPDYPRQQMSPEIIGHIKQLFVHDRPEGINLCGNGETTMLENWTAVCEPFLSLTDHPCIISNLAKVLNGEELSFLSRFDSITTSIDTADADLLKEIRKSAQLCNIALNLNLIKASAIVQGKPSPSININCTVTTKTYRELSKLVALASALGVSSITFSNLFETPNAITHGVRSLETLDSVELEDAVNEFLKAITLAAKNNISLNLSSQKLAVLLRSEKKSENKEHISTVKCLQPWNVLWINADGHVSCCCRHMGTSDKKITSYDSVQEVLNNSNAVQLRESLLSGRCPARCLSCELGHSGDLSAFRREVKTRQSSFVKFIQRIPFSRAAWRIFRRL